MTSRNQPQNDPLIAVLATRNQAVDDAQDVVDQARLGARRSPEGLVVASTVDSWQGQTNAITAAIHPLSGASALDDFNSAFGRLAVTCTRATHGLLRCHEQAWTTCWQRRRLDPAHRCVNPAPVTCLARHTEGSSRPSRGEHYLCLLSHRNISPLPPK